MYIAGTHTYRDVWDWGRIPLGDVKNSERYQQATEALNNNPQVTEVIGHSLGSNVAADLNKQNNNQFNARFYGSPFIDFSFSQDPKNQRYRHQGDWLSVFDTGAVNAPTREATPPPAPLRSAPERTPSHPPYPRPPSLVGAARRPSVKRPL